MEQQKPAAPQPTITSKAVTNAKPPIPTVSEVEIPESQIQARPLTLPGAFNIKLKNPNLSARGINFVVSRGQRLTEAKVLGFRVANQTDVASAPGWMWLDGAFRMGDLLLMVMGRREYVGAIKNNEQTSLDAASRNRTSKTNREQVHAAARAHVPPTNREYVNQRVGTFDPIAEMGEAKFEEVITQPGDPMSPLPEGMYGNEEQDSRIINKSKTPIPGE